jgi:hypothetical protein
VALTSGIAKLPIGISAENGRETRGAGSSGPESLIWNAGPKTPILSHMYDTPNHSSDPAVNTLPGNSPHIAVAPGLLSGEHTVVREPGESDERYHSRCELLAILLDFAK